MNLVAPGVVDTDINAAWLRDNAEAAEFVKSGNAMKKVTQPVDVAEVIGSADSERIANNYRADY